jgi:hypothetical protein
VLRAVDFLATLVASSAHRDFLYFGDVERDGIEIPRLLDQRLHERTAHRMTPAEQYYELLRAAGIGGDSLAVHKRILLSRGFLRRCASQSRWRSRAPGRWCRKRSVGSSCPLNLISSSTPMKSMLGLSVTKKLTSSSQA